MLSSGINREGPRMNLAAQTPHQQVAHVLAACIIGGCPDLPPFLQVSKAEQARRNEWAASHPIPPPKFMARSAGPQVDPAEEARHQERMAAERQAAKDKKRESLNAYRQTASQEWVMSLPADERRWSTRLGRFIPECIMGLERMRLVDALKAIEAAYDKARGPERNAKRRLQHRVEQASATRHAKPTPVAAPRKAAVPGKVTGNAADAITMEMLRRADGVTQAQLAERLECTGDAARGRISKVARANSLNITRSKVDGVYHAN